MLELLRRIPRSRNVPARELHDQLPADLGLYLCTVQRQLDIERDDTSKPSEYRCKEPAARLSVPTLSEQRAPLLALAEEKILQRAGIARRRFWAPHRTAAGPTATVGESRSATAPRRRLGQGRPVRRAKQPAVAGRGARLMRFPEGRDERPFEGMRQDMSTLVAREAGGLAVVVRAHGVTQALRDLASQSCRGQHLDLSATAHQPPAQFPTVGDAGLDLEPAVGYPADTLVTG